VAACGTERQRPAHPAPRPGTCRVCSGAADSCARTVEKLAPAAYTRPG